MYTESKAITDDKKSEKELIELATEELRASLEEMERYFNLTLINFLKCAHRVESDIIEDLVDPQEEEDIGGAIIELRPGAGGSEVVSNPSNLCIWHFQSALFAMEMLQMYRGFSEREGWDFSVLDSSETDLGGLKVRFYLHFSNS